METYLKKIQQHKFDIVVLAAILGWGFCLLNHLYMPYVADDEFGYWMGAAFFGGYDWKSVSSFIGYYAYGYGFILLPFLKIFSDPILCYRAAVFLNVLWLIGIYFLTKKFVCKHLKRKENIANIISACVLLYSNILVQSKLTWPELFEYFLVLIIVYLMFEITSENSQIQHYIFLAFLCGYLYIVHQRYLSIIIAVTCTLLFQLIFIPANRKKVLCFLCLFLICFGIGSTLKDIYIKGIWRSAKNLPNEYAGILTKIVNSFSTNGLIGLIYGIMGQLYYYCIAALGIGIFGIGTTIEKFYVSIKTKDKNQITRYILLVLIFLGTMGMSVLFLQGAYSQSERGDWLIYGRYIEAVINIFIILGLDKIIDLIMHKKKSIYCYLIFIILFNSIWGSIVAKYCTQNHVRSFNMISCISGGIYWNNGVFYWYIPAIIMCFILLLTVLHFNRKLGNKIFIATIGVIYLVISFNTSRKMLINIISINKTNSSCIAVTEELKNYENANLYYLTEKNVWKDRKKNSIQFLLKDKSVKCLSRNNWDRVLDDNNCIVLASNDNPVIYTLYLEGYEKLIEAEDIIALKNGMIYEKETISLIIPPEKYGSDYEVNANGSWTSDGGSGVLCYGPYIQVPYGEYTFHFNLECNTGENEDIGYIAIKDDNEAIALRGIHKSDFIDGKSMIDVNVLLPEGAEKLECCIFVNEGNILNAYPAVISRQK